MRIASFLCHYFAIHLSQGPLRRLILGQILYLVGHDQNPNITLSCCDLTTAIEIVNHQSLMRSGKRSACDRTMALTNDHYGTITFCPIFQRVFAQQLAMTVADKLKECTLPDCVIPARKMSCQLEPVPTVH